MTWSYPRKLKIAGVVVTAALVTACGGHGGTAGPLPLSALRPATSSMTFHFTRAAQNFTVPQGVTQIKVTAYGAQGGGALKSSQGSPGVHGAKVEATFSVTPGESLVVYVGSKGIRSKGHGGLEGGGFNGGGGASAGAYGGGGSSDVRQGGSSLTDRIVVAAGGGGSGENGYDSFYHGSNSGSSTNFSGTGGIGGRRVGGEGQGGQNGGNGGFGGSRSKGGRGGLGRPGSSVSFSYKTHCKPVKGSKGELLTGGTGANDDCGPAGGGGGGGYYGGGGGGGGGYSGYTATGSIVFDSGGGGGGGGGSSFVASSGTNVHQIAGGAPAGEGLIVISW